MKPGRGHSPKRTSTASRWPSGYPFLQIQKRMLQVGIYTDPSEEQSELDVGNDDKIVVGIKCWINHKLHTRRNPDVRRK